jgi:hypothetical protein
MAWSVSASLAFSVAAFLTSGTVFQAYLLESGLVNQQIGIIGSAASLTYTVALFALIGIANGVHRRIRAVTHLRLLSVVLPLGLLALTLFHAEGITPVTVLIFVVVLMLLDRVICAFNSVVQYGAMVRCVPGDMRGKLAGTNGVIGGLATFGLGIGVTFWLARTPFPWGFSACFAAAAACTVAAAMAFSRLTELLSLNHPTAERTISPLTTTWRVLKLKEFRLLLVPNVLRGLAGGVGYFVLAMGWERLGLSKEYGAAMATVTAGGALLGMVAVGMTHHRRGAGWICLVGDLFAAAGLLGVVLTGSPVWFLAFGGIFALGGTMEGAGIPLGAYDIAPPSMIGAFNGLRLLVLNGSVAVATVLVGHLLDRISPLPIFVTGAALTALTGVLYWLGFRRASRANHNRNA